MSRIGNKEIVIPSGVEVKVNPDTNIVSVKGPLGNLETPISKDMEVEINDGKIFVKRPSEEKMMKSLHGLSRTLIANMVEGVTKGYEKKLEIVGVGYRALKKGKVLELNLGFSHKVEFTDPEGIETLAPDQTHITVKGIDKQFVGNYAAKIRELRKPEPYKGKGIKYEGEYIRRKEGKTGKK